MKTEIEFELGGLPFDADVEWEVDEYGEEIELLHLTIHNDEPTLVNADQLLKLGDVTEQIKIEVMRVQSLNCAGDMF